MINKLRNKRIDELEHILKRILRNSKVRTGNLCVHCSLAMKKKNVVSFPKELYKEAILIVKDPDRESL